MSLPHNLIEDFGKVGLQHDSNAPVQNTSKDNRHPLLRRHVLKFVYPASGLITDSRKFSIDPPWMQSYRGKPPPPEESNYPQGSDYTITFEANPRSVPELLPPRHFSILQAVRQLSAHGTGTTEFRIARFVNSEYKWEPTLIRIVTFLEHDTIKLDFHLSLDEWTLLIGQAEYVPWVALLRDLVYQRSDRAVYHVREQIELSSYDQQLDSDAWNTARVRSAPELLYSSMISRVTFEPLHFEPTGPDHSLGQEVNLRCGHKMLVSEPLVESWPEGHCIYKRCEESNCRQRILGEKSEQEWNFRNTQKEVIEIEQSVRHWKSLGGDLTLRQDKIVVQASTLFQVLQASYDSMRVHELVCPEALAFQNYDETKAALEKLTDMLYAKDDIFDGTPAQLLDLLLTSVLNMDLDPSNGAKLKGAVIHPDFSNHLAIWFRRAINFWLHRNCRKMNARHYGFHMHDDVPFFNRASLESPKWQQAVSDAMLDEMEDQDEEEEVTVEEIDELVKALAM